MSACPAASVAGMMASGPSGDRPGCHLRKVGRGGNQATPIKSERVRIEFNKGLIGCDEVFQQRLAREAAQQCELALRQVGRDHEGVAHTLLGTTHGLRREQRFEACGDGVLFFTHK